MTIIGLLIGGILKGQELMLNATAVPSAQPSTKAHSRLTGVPAVIKP